MSREETAALGVVAPAEKIARAETASLHLKLGAQIFICVGGVIFGKSMLLLLQILLGRVLGATGYGLYSLGFSIMTVIVWAASAGVDWGVLRYGALYQDSPERVKGVLWSSLGLGLAVSLLIAALLFAFVHLMAVRVFADARLVLVLRLFALGLPFLVLARITSAFVQSQQEIYRMTMIQHVSQPALNLLLVAGGFWLGWGLGGAIAAYGASFALATVIGFRYVRQTFPAFLSSLRPQFNLGPLLRYSLALVAIGISYQLLLRAPSLLLGVVGDVHAVGVYTAGASFAMAMAIFPGVFAQPFVPMMVDLYDAKKMEQVRWLYRMVARWTALVILPVSLLLCLFRDEIMALYGREFRGAGTVLLFLSVAWLFYFVKGPGAPLLDMTGRQNIDLLNMLGIGALTVALNWLLIPRYGAVGAAAGTSAAMLMWAGLESFEVWALYGILPWSRATLRLFLVAGVAATAGFLLRPRLPWQFAATAVLLLYGLLFLAFGLVDEDREFARTGLERLRAAVMRAGPGPAEGRKLSSSFYEPD